MNVLVACEESQAVCKAFRAKGHRAFSVDLLECSGGHPEWHIKGDCLPLINGNCSFKTEDGTLHMLFGRWDMLLAFPPCTHLSSSGARHFEKKRNDGRQLEAIKFFDALLKADCDKIVVENPVNIIGSRYIKEWFPQYAYIPNYTQKIQPYEYGHKSKKTTCLWIKGLPNLIPANIVEPDLVTFVCKSGKKVTFSSDYGSEDKTSGKRRSKTYVGIAEAMADQWG